MQAISQYGQQPDEELVLQSSSGDREAFATLYDRYFQGIYDFAVRIVRDSDVAADVVQNTFTKAWENLRKQRIPENVKAWLYTVGRNNAIDELRHRKRLIAIDKSEVGDRGFFSFTEVDTSKLSNPEAVAEDKELIELVWSSASALSPKEYSLLDMHLRQGLSADEIATNLGVRKGNIYTMLSRLRDSLQESVTSSLLMRRGRRDCPELDALLSELHATEITRNVRQVVQSHLQECPHCQESKRRYLSPVEIFTGLALVPAIPMLQSLVWQKVISHIDSGTASEGTVSQAMRHPIRWWAGASIATKVIVFVVIIIIAAVGGALATGTTSVTMYRGSVSIEHLGTCPIQPGDLKVTFHFPIPMKDQPNVVYVRPLDGDGNSTDPQIALVPDPGWEGDSEVHNGKYTVTNTELIPCPIEHWDVTRQASVPGKKAFVVYMVSPTDIHGNVINDISVTFVVSSVR